MAMLAELRKTDPLVLVIGASAGAVETLKQLLPHLPASFPIPVLVVVHVPPDRDTVLARVFAPYCALEICEAEDKVPAEAGCVYFAPPDYHLLVAADRTLALSVDEPVHFSRPSIDVLFESAAYEFNERTLGILLSGASADGAGGLLVIRRSGGLTWVQDPASAPVDTMPKAALGMFPHPTLTPGEMGELLAAWEAHRG